MSTKNIYLPQTLADQLEGLDLNISTICQEALRAAIEMQTHKCSRCGSSLSDSTITEDVVEKAAMHLWLDFHPTNSGPYVVNWSTISEKDRETYRDSVRRLFTAAFSEPGDAP